MWWLCNRGIAINIETIRTIWAVIRVHTAHLAGHVRQLDAIDDILRLLLQSVSPRCALARDLLLYPLLSLNEYLLVLRLPCTEILIEDLNAIRHVTQFL